MAVRRHDCKYIEAKAKVELIILSLGTRGESNDLWKQPGQTEENVKKIRWGETTKAAEILGISNIDFWDLSDYPMNFTDELQDRLVRKIREVKPNVILSHDKWTL